MITLMDFIYMIHTVFAVQLFFANFAPTNGRSNEKLQQ